MRRAIVAVYGLAHSMVGGCCLPRKKNAGRKDEGRYLARLASLARGPGQWAPSLAVYPCGAMMTIWYLLVDDGEDVSCATVMIYLWSKHEMLHVGNLE